MHLSFKMNTLTSTKYISRYFSIHSKNFSFKSSFVYSKEVKNAINKNLPIVALESTIISHGMPYPDNYNTAKDVETIVRENGAIPATIALLDGKKISF